ncbi:MAG: Periplasmic protease, partial [Armatimonadetes bacterium]|nr:Periplasmic protease [Armatimonadota bacterium]
NDMWPMWGPDSQTVYSTSERNGMATVWRQSREGGAPAPVVDTPPDAIRYPSLARGGKTLAFECDGAICTADAGPSSGPTALRPVKILCRTDERGAKTASATYTSSNVSEFALSPDGKRAAFVVRGDIFAVSIEKGGEAKRLTNNPTRDQDVAWSTDGKSIVFSSNRDGGYRIYSVDVASGTTTQLTRGGGIDTDPLYSPDGKWIAFRRGPQTSLYVIRPDGSGEQLAVKGPKIWDYQWSPDSRWLTFMQEDEIRNRDVWVVSLGQGDEAIKPEEPINVTDHPGFNVRPQWFRDGSRLLFGSNRYRNRDIETINDQGRFALYTVSLQKDKEKQDDEDPLDLPKPAPAPATTEPKPEAKKLEVKVDPQEIERRSKPLASFEEGISSLSVSPDSKTVIFVAQSQGRGDIWQVGADGKGQQRLTTSGESPFSFVWAPDSSRIYYLSGGAIRWIARGGGATGVVGFTARMEIDRTVDYRAAYDEAWQILNDSFYDRKFHGADWKAVGAKYRALVDHVTTRRDFNYVVTQLFGELNASHTGIRGGENRTTRETGYLGISADEEHTGPGVKIAAVMPRSPAEQEESRLQAGEYVLSIDGADVTAGTAYDRALTEKVGRTVSLLVNSKPEKDGARTVRLKPINRTKWLQLVYEQRLDRERALADKLSGGRFGYLHVADMGDEARNRFERELFSVGQRKDGMVLDFRGNNGGDTHDSLLRILARNRHYFTFAPRVEAPFPQPEKAYVKPIVLLIDEFSLSDAEVFANGFRELGLGKIVGVPTMGWIIFTHSQSLVDGSQIRVPHMGCFTLDGRDLENWGVPPDVRVEYTPADSAADRDPQLERAIQELQKDPRLKKK